MARTTDVTTDDLALYVLDGCSYCDDVREACEELGIEIEERDLRDRAHHRALVEARGRRTVPVLRIGEDTWMPESGRIIRFLYERFGTEGQRPPFRFGPLTQVVLWGLLLGGGLARDPWQSGLWATACALAAARSLHCGWRTRHWVHWAVGGAFAFGALSITLYAAGLADMPWWYAAFVLAAVVLGGALARGFRTAGARS